MSTEAKMLYISLYFLVLFMALSRLKTEFTETVTLLLRSEFCSSHQFLLDDNSLKSEVALVSLGLEVQ